MGNFEDFIRYGFPGYTYIGTVSVAILLSGGPLAALLSDGSLATIIGAAIIVVGPLIGFLIHQIYFLYFDKYESYEKISRPSIKLLARILMLEEGNERISNSVVQKQAFMSWKLLTTNFESELKLDSLYITRLRSLRNFSHSFGAIVTSNILAAISVFFVAVWTQSQHGGLGVVLMCNFMLFALFLYKRIDVSNRINEMEIAIVLRDRKLFASYMLKLIERDEENKELLESAGM